MKGITGYVATLDVLGFAELLYRERYAQRLRVYLATINEVIRPAHVKIECVVFSDSIVLTSSGQTEESFRGLITACSATFHELVMCDMPVRGAIAFGRYWRETSGGSVFLAGRPIVEAYRCERAQKWVGVILCSSVLHQQDNLGLANSLTLLSDGALDPPQQDLAVRLQPATVPFQEPGGPHGQLSAYAIVPLAANDKVRGAHRSISRTRSHLEYLRLKAPYPAAQEKYTASLNWLEEIESRLREMMAPAKASPTSKKPLSY
jgi:hypothetical protein